MKLMFIKNDFSCYLKLKTLIISRKIWVVKLLNSNLKYFEIMMTFSYHIRKIRISMITSMEIKSFIL